MLVVAFLGNNRLKEECMKRGKKSFEITSYMFLFLSVFLDMAFIIAMLLASLNSCCNPWIYMFFAGHLFHDLMQCFFCCCRRYLTECSCSCDQQCRHKRGSSTYVNKNTNSQRSLSRTSSMVH